VHSGVRSDWLVEQMVAGGPEYLDAIATYELDVIQANRAQAEHLREPLVTMYPQDGTLMVGHPFTILDRAPWVSREQAAAALVLRAHLLSTEVQQAALALGLRPADPAARLESPIDAAHGANPDAAIIAMSLPDSDVIDQIVQVWHQVKKHAVVALVFDKSGSMTGSKITAAVQGAQLFVRSMDRDDRLIWIAFDTTVQPPVEGFGADVSEDLGPRIAATGASGGTALYDAVLRAFDQVDALRRLDPGGKRYGIVVLSDGKDEDSRSALADVEAQLKPGEADPTAIQIHTIAIGNDAEEDVLMRIATAGHGKFWKGQTARDMAVIYRSIATYY
jgi:Ca-activated chloride channel homolog